MVITVGNSDPKWILTPYINGIVGTPNSSTDYSALDDVIINYTFYVGNAVENAIGW